MRTGIVASTVVLTLFITGCVDKQERTYRGINTNTCLTYLRRLHGGTHRHNGGKKENPLTRHRAAQEYYAHGCDRYLDEEELTARP